MSDMQTLIHTNAMHAYDQGVKAERRRIIKLLEELDAEKYWGINLTISKLIQVEQND